MPSDAKKLADWLHRPGPLQSVLSHAEQLVQVTRELREWLREPWSETVRVASSEGDTVVLYAANAPAATLLRFHGPAIVAWLRQRCNPACTNLQIKVQPDTYTAK